MKRLLIFLIFTTLVLLQCNPEMTDTDTFFERPLKEIYKAINHVELNKVTKTDANNNEPKSVGAIKIDSVKKTFN